MLYSFNTHKWEGSAMPRTLVGTSERVSLRIASDEKLLLMRAAALQHTNLTEFVIRNVVRVLSGASSECITTNVLEGMKVVDIIQRIYALK